MFPISKLLCYKWNYLLSALICPAYNNLLYTGRFTGLTNEVNGMRVNPSHFLQYCCQFPICSNVFVLPFLKALPRKSLDFNFSKIFICILSYQITCILSQLASSTHFMGILFYLARIKQEGIQTDNCRVCLCWNASQSQIFPFVSKHSVIPTDITLAVAEVHFCCKSGHLFRCYDMD